jgi:sulfur dioxygenase
VFHDRAAAYETRGSPAGMAAALPAPGGDMIFRQLFDRESSTYTYLLGDEISRHAALIDPVLVAVDRDLRLVAELGLELQTVLETHVHADHITAAGSLRRRAGARTVASVGGAPCVDTPVRHGDIVHVGAIAITVLATPGHSDDSVSFLVGDRVFTGDALLIRSAGRTDFQNGNAGQLYDSIRRVLFGLPDDTRVYPAHDYRGLTMSTVGEEKRCNGRIAGRSRDQFIALMSGLNLPPPQNIDVAVPANRACGEA